MKDAAINAGAGEAAQATDHCHAPRFPPLSLFSFLISRLSSHDFLIPWFLVNQLQTRRVICLECLISLISRLEIKCQANKHLSSDWSAVGAGSISCKKQKKELEEGPPLRRYLINSSRWWVDHLLLWALVPRPKTWHSVRLSLVNYLAPAARVARENVSRWSEENKD